METPPNQQVDLIVLSELVASLKKHEDRIVELERRGPAWPSIESARMSSVESFVSDKYVPAAAYDALLRKYHELAEQSQETSERHRQAAEKCLDLQDRLESQERRYYDLCDKYRQARNIAKQWKEYYDRKVASQAKQQKGIDTPMAILQDIPAAALHSEISHGVDSGDIFRETDSIEDITAALRPSTTTVHPRPNVDEGSATPKAAAAKVLPANLQRHPSSQSTEVPSSPPPAATQPKRAHSSDEEPEVVSTRAIKRRRVEPPESVRVKQEPVSQPRAIELSSDGINSQNASRDSVLREISDLDSVPPTSNQLRKRRHNFLTRTRSRSEEYPSPFKPSLLQHNSSLSQSHEGNVVIHEDLIPVKQPVTAPGVSPTPGVLQPISTNTSTPQRSPRSVNRVRQTSSNFHSKIGELSEGGEESRSPRKGQIVNPSKVLPAELKGRLGGLLDGASPAPQPILLAGNGSPIARLRNMKDKPATPVNHPPVPDNRTASKAVVSNTPKTAVAKTGLTKQLGPSRLNDSESRSTSRQRKEPLPPPPRPALPTKPAGPPLRSKPLAELRLDDFKINPKYQDTDFAFADTLRGRDARRCIPGCTKPECCGSAFQEALQLAGGSKLSDAQVLESYLGPNWELLIGGYGPDKRQETLTNARTAAFANEFGKHREVFARHSTPPGFWAADFPSTQEAAEYRALASQMEKGKIEERWREASRVGGRWIFRDE